MQTIYKYILSAVFFALCVSSISAQQNTIISTIKKEVDRNYNNLKIDKLRPPFFINYTLIEAKHMSIEATLGSLLYSNDYKIRYGMPSLLVGDYNRNNINFGNNYAYPTNVSFENEGIATSIWSSLDRVYKAAAESYEAKVAAIAQQNIDKEELELPDFEKITPANAKTEPQKLNQDKVYWENFAKQSSAVLKKYPEIIRSSVAVYIRDAVVYTYNTENTEIVTPSPYYQVVLQMFTITPDGEEMSRETYFEHPTFEQMPSLKTFTDTCEVLAKRLVAYRNAPLITEAYSGPVLFEGQAVPELFQSLVSSLIAARKPITGNGGNNLEMMKGKKLISRNLTVKSLSGSETYKGNKLDAYYPVDAEGVAPAKELVLVENGVLKNMLNGRTPTKKFPNSNGHRRMNIRNLNTAIMPGNSLLLSNLTFSDMTKKLIEAAKEEDLEYAYIISGFRGQPFEVYRIYVSDGRKELVRGVVLQDFNHMKSFKRILGTSDKELIYNTYAFGNFATYIVPNGILFEELEITRNNNLTLKTPFIVSQPK